MKKKETETIFAEVEAKIIPKSSRNEIVSEESGLIKIKVTSPPVDGKANKAVVNLLAKHLKVSKKDIQIISGEKSRNKRIRIYGVSSHDFFKMLD